MSEKTATKQIPEVQSLVLESIVKMVEDMQGSLPSFIEVVVHDLSKLPNSVVAVAGTVTNRVVGSPPTNKLLRDFSRNEWGRYASTYQSTLPDGRVLNCMSLRIAVRDQAIGTLCINIDTSIFAGAFQALANLAPAFAALGAVQSREGELTGNGVDIPEEDEVFPLTIEDLVRRLIDESVAAVGVPVELMKKDHKKAVVRELQDRGAFVVKNSVEDVAEALNITRFTVYNYIKEIEAEPAPDA